MKVTQCPSCGAKFNVPETAIGRQTKCLECKATFRIAEIEKQEEPHSASPSADLLDSANQAVVKPDQQSTASSMPFPDPFQSFEPEPNEIYGIKGDSPTMTSWQSDMPDMSRTIPSRGSGSTSRVVRRNRMTKKGNDKEYPALRRLAYIHRVGGILCIITAVLAGCLFFICLFLTFKSGDKNAPEIIGISLIFVVASVFNALLCFAVAEIIQWGIDLKGEISTANSLLTEIADKLDR